MRVLKAYQAARGRSDQSRRDRPSTYSSNLDVKNRASCKANGDR